jgi:hypothetical protein
MRCKGDNLLENTTDRRKAASKHTKEGCLQINAPRHFLPTTALDEGSMDGLLEVFARFDMLSFSLKHEAHVMAAMITRWKFLAVNTRDFMFFSVTAVMDHPVNAGMGHFFSGSEFITTVCHLGILSVGINRC